MAEVIKVLLEGGAAKVAEKIGAKALVIMEELPEEEIPDIGITVVIVGSTFDVEKDKVKRISIPPQNLDLNNLLNLISAFLLEHGILAEGDSFVYVTENLIGGVRTIKRSIIAMKSFFAQNQNVLQRMLEIAIELSIEGREGNPVGTIFVIGDTRRVLKHSRQLIPNPFKGGHRINVLDKESKEIIKEFAQLDGAFLIREDGRIVAAGRYLEVEPRVIDLMLPPLGWEAGT